MHLDGDPDTLSGKPDMKRKITWLVMAVVVLVIMGLALRGPAYRMIHPTQTPQGVSIGADPAKAEVVADRLHIPWSLAFLPDGDLLVTERPGTLLRLGRQRIEYRVEGVEATGEGGLLGLALHPEFAANRYVYLYSTTRSGGDITNRVERYRLESDRLSERKAIVTGIPGGSFHDGGRIAFGPDGLLYIGTGDGGDSNAAQDVHSLAGKILRVTDDGAVPDDNPFGNAVYSYGHRNVEGLAWDDRGRLWSTEHGPSGFETGNDEINLIEKGKNYGWPVIRGMERHAGMETPVVESGRNYTWAPASAAYLHGSLYFGGLRGEALYEARLGRDPPEIVAHFLHQFGRIRDVVVGPDGRLYFSTSNTDGRGVPHENDDKILRVNPVGLR